MKEETGSRETFLDEIQCIRTYVQTHEHTHTHFSIELQNVLEFLMYPIKLKSSIIEAQETKNIFERFDRGD